MSKKGWNPRQGTFTLDSMVPDQPIGVPDGGEQSTKWISNYDGQFKGIIPLREALLGIWLILIGLLGVLGGGILTMRTLLDILAIAAGAFILIGR